MLRCLVPILAALALIAGCSDSPPKPATPEKAPTPEKALAPPGQAPDKAPPKAPEAAPAIEAAVFALVDAWLKAQNDGAFEAYAALYAARFFGIKRSGERTYRFDRAGWVKDRRRMFGKPMTVSAADMKIVPGPSSAIVQFTQTWASGSYRDVGPKQLVVTKQGDAWRISREEMLSSTLLDPTPRAADGVDLHLVTVLDAPYVVLGKGVEVSGTPRVFGDEKGLRTVGVKAPSTADPRHGARVVLYGSGAKACEGTIDQLAVISRVWPHFSAADEWNGGIDGDLPQATPAQVARDLWAMGERGRLLVGRVTADAEACKGAVFARFEAPGAAPPRQWTPWKHPDDNTVPHAVGMLREHAKWKALQEVWVADGGTGSWDASYEAKVTGFSPASGEPHLFIAFDAGFGCGEFGGALWSAWRWYTKGVAMSGAPQHDRIVPLAMLDGPGGAPIAVAEVGYSGERVSFLLTDGEWVPVRRLLTVDLTCPC